MSAVWALLGVALIVVWAITVADIVRRHLGAQRTAAWLLIVLIVPFIGAALYWARRQPEARTDVTPHGGA